MIIDWDTATNCNTFYVEFVWEGSEGVTAAVIGNTGRTEIGFPLRPTSDCVIIGANF